MDVSALTPLETECEWQSDQLGDSYVFQLTDEHVDELDRALLHAEASCSDVLDITRDAHRHVAFGGGAHYCLGAALARAEAQIALAALVTLPGLELAIDEPEWRPLVTLHALQSLPVNC